MTQEYVNTVTGPIGVEELGVTLMHEHILIGYPGWEADTLRPGPGRAEMVDTAVDKIRSMQSIGIQSMLDPCPNDLGRDVGLAAEVADKTGFNIICATGLYKENEGGFAHWHFVRSIGRGVEAMAELFIHEITKGIGDTGIKAGIIMVASPAPPADPITSPSEAARASPSTISVTTRSATSDACGARDSIVKPDSNVSPPTANSTVPAHSVASIRP